MNHSAASGGVSVGATVPGRPRDVEDDVPYKRNAPRGGVV